MPNRPNLDDDEALHEALRRLLAPFARLAVARGVSHGTIDEWLRQALVQEAFDAHADMPAHRRVSRVSASTGLHRRDVARLLEQRHEPPVPEPSLASVLFTRWQSDPKYLDASGRALTLPRVGKEPSFESLAQSVTRDVHPRTLLEELLRLKLASLNETLDTVSLGRVGFVPRNDVRRMAGYLGENVGDHLQGAVANLLEGGARHFEQAIYADGLSAESVAAFKTLVGEQWRQMTQAVVPKLEALLQADEARRNTNGPDTKTDTKIDTTQHRVRLGLYGFDAMTIEAQPTPAPAQPPSAPRGRGRPRTVTAKPDDATSPSEGNE